MLSFVSSVAFADAAQAQTCLTPKEMREAISTNEAVQPALAIKNARAAAHGDVVRVRLCKDTQGKDDQELVYQVTIIKRDGRVQRVTIGASSGNVTGVR